MFYTIGDPLTPTNMLQHIATGNPNVCSVPCVLLLADCCNHLRYDALIACVWTALYETLLPNFWLIEVPY